MLNLMTLSFDADKKRRYIERFERETLLCSRLQHPNIVRLLDKGREDNDLLYAVFEYVEGSSLKERLVAQSGPLLPAEAAHIMAQVLDALAHAHSQGVIHRDIKPANIMLSQVGATTHVKILDFGIGSLVNEARQLDYKTITLTHETLGTPSYSAPEQLRGEPPTPQSDIYVWGLVFLECLTGNPAISGSNLASIFHKQLSHSNVPLPPVIAGHPVAVLLRRLLNKKTDERAANAAELYHEFTQINLVTIVGDFRDQAPSSSYSATTQEVSPQQDQTLVNNTQLYYTNLTEVKQITVLCLTLTINPITELTANLEILDTLHRDQKAQCVDTAIRFGAYHVGTLGDTLLFYFGYPKVSENDCRLCARTALEIHSNLTKTNALLKQTQGIEILPRMGIHTGAITIYSDTAPEGETPNIALALTRLAKPMQVLCSESTKSQLERYIEFEPTGGKLTNYQQRALSLFSLKGERAVEAFGFLRANHSNQNFIARKHELEKLSLLIPQERQAPPLTTTEQRLAHVCGEAGIGKSRLTFELRRLAKHCNHYIAQCLPEHKHNALYPVFNLLKYQYSFNSLSPTDAIQLLRRDINHFHQLDEKLSIPILCSWLGLPLPKDLTESTFAPDAQKQILFDTLNCLINSQRGKTTKPHNLFIFEDIHWADPTTIEFIDFWINSKQFIQAKSVYISTSRVELPKQLADNSFSLVKLPKLDYDNTAEFIISRFDHQSVSDQVLDIIATRTDGIPLFIEEMVNMLKQKQLVHHLNGIIDFSSPDKINEVPSSLRASLQQKLDSLVYSKETAQLAATIGREFNYRLLVAASSRSEEQVQTDLHELVEADLVYLQRKIGDDSYIFKHALVRDSAYESMVKKAQVKAHLIVAETLEIVNQHHLKQVSSLLYSHFSKTGNTLKTAEYAKLAAENAMKISEYSQAIYYAQASYELFDKIKNKTIEKLLVNQILTKATMRIQGWGSPYVIKLIKTSESLLMNCSNVESNTFISIYWSLALYNCNQAKYKEVYQLVHKVVNHNSITINDGDQAALYALQTHCYWSQGKLEVALSLTNKILNIYNERNHSDHCEKYCHDTKTLALGIQMFIHTHYGNYDLAKEKYIDAKNHYKLLESHHSKSMTEIYWCCCLYFQNKKTL